MAHRSFRTPKDNAGTRHLFVANCGVSAGLSESRVRELFDNLGAVALQDDKRSIVFASFKDSKAASHAAAELRSEEVSRSYKKFIVKYALLNEEEISQKEGQIVYLSTEDCGVPGLKLLLDFVTPGEEQALLGAVDEIEWETLASRRVQHYGFRFEYKTRRVSDPVQPFPQATAPVLQRLQQLPDLPHLDQLTVNEYCPGVGLAPHIDTHSAFTGAIASLSLSGGCVMEMRNKGEHRAVYLPPRSLLIMSGPSRYEWLHYIPHRKSDMVQGLAIPRSQRRVSFTFRKIRGFPCNCIFPEDCDSQASQLPITRMQELELNQQRQKGIEGADQPVPGALESIGENLAEGVEAGCRKSGAGTASGMEAERDCLGNGHPREMDSNMESRHVHAVYEVIASHFSATRFAVWPKVKEYLMALPERGVLADVGCGNGKYFAVRPDLIVLGSDRSFNLASQAAKLCRLTDGSLGSGFSVAGAAGHLLRGRGGPPAPLADVVVADGMHLPYQNGCVDGAISIAVLHHISSIPRRVQFLGEMARILKPGGLGLVTVWASQQEDHKKLAKWELISPSNPDRAPPGSDEGAEKQPVGEGGDYFVPWHVPFHRADAVSAMRLASGKDAGSAEGGANGRIDKDTSSIVFKRYYHLFDQGEVEGLVADVPDVTFVSSLYDKSNWCCIFRRNLR